MFWWVELYLVLRAVQCPVCAWGCLWVWYGFGQSANVQGCAPVLLKSWHRASSTKGWRQRRAPGKGACWLLGWGLVLILRWRPLGGLFSINVSWDWEFYDSSKSWTPVFHLRGSTPNPNCSTKISQATEHRRQNSKTVGEGNTQQPRTPRETHTKVLQYF